MDEKKAMPEGQKPVYEAPIVVALGELGSGKGQQRICQVGTAALGDCANGFDPQLNCTDGAAVPR